MKEILEAASALLARAGKLTAARARAIDQRVKAAAEAGAAETALVRASGDALLADGGNARDLERLAERADRAARAARVARQVVADLDQRVAVDAAELGRVRDELTAELQRALGGAFDGLLAAAQEALAPIKVRFESLVELNPGTFLPGGSAGGAVANLVASMSGIPVADEQPQATAADLKLLGDVRRAIGELSRAEEQLREILRAAREMKATAPRTVGANELAEARA